MQIQTRNTRSMRAAAGRILLAGFLAAVAGQSQTPVRDRFLPIPGWAGTFSWSMKEEGEGQDQLYSYKWKMQSSASGTLQLDQRDPDWTNDRWAGWIGAVRGTLTVNHSITMTPLKPSPILCTITRVTQGSYPIGTDIRGNPTRVRLIMGPDGVTYDLEIVDGSRAPVERTQTTSGPAACGKTSSEKNTEPWFYSQRHLALPQTGVTLNGTVKLKEVWEPDWGLVYDGSAVKLYYEPVITWNLAPPSADDIDLIVDPLDYKKWRPTAGTGGTPGEPLSITAELKTKDGKTPQVKASRIVWELRDTSREPGYAMNAPIQNPGKDYDLRFGDTDRLVIDDAEGQKASTYPADPATGTTTAVARVVPSDWGGWSTLKVTAELMDGRKVEGHLAGEDATKDIRLPKRFPDSSIAEIWLEQNKMTGSGDRDDDEDNPEGDLNRGDGLTLYEEYRGFIEAGRHIEGNPRKKDYFIRNKGTGKLLPGIKMFASLSGLEVHYKFQDTEFASDRVMNRNFSAGPHRVDQHGIVILLNPTIHGFMRAVGGPGNPKMIRYVEVPAKGIVTGLPMGQEESDYRNTSLVHELLHACNVWHHGDKYTEVRWQRRPGTEIVLEDGKEVDVRTEAGDPASSQVAVQANDVVLGEQQGVHSGPDNCVMRYDDAKAYRSQADPKVRYVVEEAAGSALCNAFVGTGVNDSGHKPQSRYGNAASGRGFCRSQILVNDAVTAPRR